ncbi:CxxC_CxxC_SSSS, putative regulatory protein, FmdB family [uncultured Caudovirales phage]|jgi:putative FmdB family regulatory protein|uniref:CxxC_CxxC_SSSS, putative regulatory protein, FmdB family n=1 Tax=uncultured Caudovirales phage TaxID=2100421 RepID=A0A6J5MIE7_9CAUD|nr:CxxC_CxxC_SSSS, putative regulatory protein, FmdB family [uncultured Caudovirales phage]CAB4150992.1 CxxC_CxxC_SSSS, putative regulatory protein, FmdB family [uncultured Caudovirales phage]CAB4174670.1 CxxC_CxxC_SSSS, putative regulatory protein, FmdB family [uncultured Caudovirales phage]CAB4179862.1 CxxC_CxxC_SSSS, putative regulatory protein, FmdB family [uncultured Caudovirales phage]CAB4185503.1 CxxC_CxxC_SSSS, putative regulatory protein, FmdB family [uncultured Caudovirales phage]
MPTYSYTCIQCDKDLERMTKIDYRDNQFCDTCGFRLARTIDRPGMVWSPTRNGGYSV